jgi:hypothetical protein
MTTAPFLESTYEVFAPNYAKQETYKTSENGTTTLKK